MNGNQAGHLEIVRNPACITEDFALAVATVIVSVDKAKLKVLLTRKNSLGSEGRWALPGGVVHLNEPLEQAASRAVSLEFSGLSVKLRQFRTFGRVDRYPGKRLVTIAFYALTGMRLFDSKEWRWFPFNNVPRLAIDHNKIVEKALGAVQRMAQREPIGEDLLPDSFTMAELQNLYEGVLQRKLDPRSFQRQMWSLDLLIPLTGLDASAQSTKMRYTFNRSRYRWLQEHGLAAEF
jgi:8-oxo-dGTP diphosphatase